MAGRRDLDETDLAIIRLLAADARRSYREIADEVGLSAPAVSDRIDRLRDQGIIRRFTIDLDRSRVHPQTPVLIEVAAEPGEAKGIEAAIADLDGVEHVFRTVDGRFVVHASAPDEGVGAWLHAELDLETVRDLSVSLLESYAWHPEIDEAQFSLECVVCGNRVDSDGVTAEFDGEVKSFCCPSCLTRYEDRYESHQSQAD